MKKSSLIFSFTLLLLFLSINNNVFAQLDSSDFDYSISLKVDMSSTDGMDTLYFHQIDLTLYDTLNVGKIAVKIGSSDGANDVEDYEFEFDKTTFLPKYYSYYRKGNQLTLVVGEHEAGTYFYEVKLIDKNGLTTAPKKI